MGAVAAALLASACTGGSHAKRPDSGAAQTPPAGLRHKVSAATNATFPITTGAAALTLRISRGDFVGAGSVTVTTSTVAPPRLDWFTPDGPVRNVEVRGRLAHPLTLAMTTDPQHANDLATVLRHDAIYGWYPVAVGDLGHPASAPRYRFSPHLPGWTDITNWLGRVTGKVGRWATGRTTPPTCASGAPSWSSLDQAADDILLSCTQTNQGRVELQVKNNRGLIQEITVPRGIAYANVEDQPEPTRALVRQVGGGSDIVLLPPGKRLSIGFTRPARDTDITITPTVSTFALVAELFLQVADLADQAGNDSLVAALVNLVHCAGLSSEVASGMLPDGLHAVKDLVVGGTRCLAETLADPVHAVQLAQQIVATSSGAPLAVVQSDSKFGAQVDYWSGKLNLAGKVARAFKTAELAKLAFTIWQNIGEMLGRANASPDPAVVTLHLAGRPVQSPEDAPWTAPTLLITPTALGAVRDGMSLQQAQAAARLRFPGGGDGAYYPVLSGPHAPHLYVRPALGANFPSCRGAYGDGQGRPMVVTAEGFRLGGSVTSLKNLYGARLAYLPAPAAGGIEPHAGWVLRTASGTLIFALDAAGRTITEIAGSRSPTLTPSGCPG